MEPHQPGGRCRGGRAGGMARALPGPVQPARRGPDTLGRGGGRGDRPRMDRPGHRRETGGVAPIGCTLAAAVPRHPPPRRQRPRRDARVRPVRLRRGAGVRRDAGGGVSRLGLGRARVRVARGRRHRPVPPARHAGAAGGCGVDRQLGGWRAHGGTGGVPARPAVPGRGAARHPWRALPARGARVAGPLRRPLPWLAAQPRRSRRLRPPRVHGARAAAVLRDPFARHPHHPRVRGAGLRHPADLGAVGRRGGPVHAGRGLPGGEGRRGGGARGRATILARHSCAHRAEELLGIVHALSPDAPLLPSFTGEGRGEGGASATP